MSFETQPTPAAKPSLVVNPFSFKGRILRSQYWVTTLLVGLPYFFLELMVFGANSDTQDALLIPFLLYAVFYIVAAASLCVRRLHDLGYSGYYFFAALIPLVNIYFGIKIGFFKGEPFDNDYGPSPYANEE
ncbi:MAG: DUF805 domain-containing protein [Bacteroidaceae bacterium]|nr:DUF805 domain-containing protein [Bacteroidaceae bacterium]